MVDVIETDPIHNSDSDWYVLTHGGNTAVLSKEKENGNYKVMRAYEDVREGDYKLATVKNTDKDELSHEKIEEEKDEEVSFETKEELEERLEEIAR